MRGAARCARAGAPEPPEHRAGSAAAATTNADLMGGEGALCGPDGDGPPPSLRQLHKPAQLSKQVQLLRPRPRKDLRAGTKCQVAGWGATEPDGLSPSDTLREVTVTVISRRLCNSPRFYNRQPVITKGLVCAGDARGQKDSCQVSARSCGPGAQFPSSSVQARAPPGHSQLKIPSSQ